LDLRKKKMIIVLDERKKQIDFKKNYIIYLSRTIDLKKREICLQSFIEKNKKNIRNKVLEIFYKIQTVRIQKKTAEDYLKIFGSSDSFFYATTLFYKCNWVTSEVYNDLIKIVGILRLKQDLNQKNIKYFGENFTVKKFFQCNV